MNAREITMIGTSRRGVFQPLKNCRSNVCSAFLLVVAIIGSAGSALSATIEIGDHGNQGRTPNQIVVGSEQNSSFATNADEKLSLPVAGVSNFAGIIALKLKLKTPEEAADVARELQFHPADARAWRLLGEYHFRRTEFGEAATNFSKSFDLDPTDALAANDLAASLVMLGKKDEAKRMLETGLRNHPKNQPMRFNLACIAAQQNRKKEAISLLLELEQMRWPLLQIHLADPDLDSMRSDIAFLALLQRVNRLPAGMGAYDSITLEDLATRPK